LLVEFLRAAPSKQLRTQQAKIHELAHLGTTGFLMSAASNSDAIAVALEKVERYGRLPDDNQIETRQLLDGIISERLIRWNKTRGRYELTAFGHKWLIVYSRGRSTQTAAKRSYFIVNLSSTGARE
jgi:hypothetical protein